MKDACIHTSITTEVMLMEKREARFRILGKVFAYSTAFFHREGFVQLMPVMLGKSVDPLGPDPGSSVVAIPEITYQDETFRLVTSMILHKQVAVKEFSRIFVMSPNVRLEHPKRKETGKHLFEFTQADFEMRDAKMDDVFALVERYFAGLSSYLEKEAKEEFAALGLAPFAFTTPFPRHTTKELAAKYGEDWELPASKDHKQPFWATSLKREFYDKEDPLHPGEYLNYDLIYPLGFGEGLSGAEREHTYERIIYRIGRDKLDKGGYATYLAFAKQGFSPSAGGGIGIERLARFLTRAPHIAELSYFKRVPGMTPML